MVKTLIETIKQVKNAYELVSNYTSVDEDAGLRRLFDKWKNNPIVKAVAKKETTFVQEYEKTFGQYTGSRLFWLNSVPTTFKEQVADLEACIGYSSLKESNFDYYVPTNPIAGTSYAAIGLIVTGAAGKISRRDLFKVGGFMTGGFTFLGATFGGVDSFSQLRSLNRLKQNAEYLDATYKRIYSKA